MTKGSIAVLSFLLLVGCGGGVTNSSKVTQGMPLADLLEILGQPQATFTAPDGRGAVLAWCGTDYTGLNGDSMHYVWVQQKQVRETVADNNRLIGQCYEFFRQPNWEATHLFGRLQLRAVGEKVTYTNVKPSTSDSGSMTSTTPTDEQKQIALKIHVDCLVREANALDDGISSAETVGQAVANACFTEREGAAKLWSFSLNGQYDHEYYEILNAEGKKSAATTVLRLRAERRKERTNQKREVPKSEAI
jgi:hypothetical protein